MSQIFSIALGIIAAGQGAISPIYAASLHVSPVNLRMEPAQQAIALTLSNPSNQPLVAQVRIFAWTQDRADDQLSAQSAVIASPPLATIPEHSEQLVRIVRLDRSAPGAELAYRLLIDELPDLTLPRQNGAIDIRIRYSIPLFVIPAKSVNEANLQWQLVRRDAVSYLSVTNSGGSHAQLSRVTLKLSDGNTVLFASGLLGYSLAASTREWLLPEQARNSSSVRVSTLVNGRDAAFEAIYLQSATER